MTLSSLYILNGLLVRPAVHLDSVQEAADQLPAVDLDSVQGAADQLPAVDLNSVQGAADQLCSLSSLISGQGQRLDRELGPLSRCESEEQLDSLDPQQQQQLVYTTSSTPDKLLTFRSFDQNYR